MLNVKTLNTMWKTIIRIAAEILIMVIAKKK